MQQNNQYQLVVSNAHTGITAIENIFITEYMPRANAAYVKIYLYGLMAAGNPQAIPMDNRSLAELFDITEGDVVNAWQYWQDQGILEMRFAGQDQYIINFFNIGEVLLSGKPKQKRPAPQKDLYDKDVEAMFERIQVMYGGRPVSRADMEMYLSWIHDYGFDTGTVILLIEYALNMLSSKGNGFTETGARQYMKPIAKSWHQIGICHFQQAEQWLTENKKRSDLYRKVERALGFRRGLMQNEAELVNSWKKELHCSDELIDLALKRTTKPSLTYVTGIIKRWREQGWTTVAEVEAQDYPQKPSRHSSSKLSPEDVQSYQEGQKRDEDWLNAIGEDRFDEIQQKLHRDTVSN